LTGSVRDRSADERAPIDYALDPSSMFLPSILAAIATVPTSLPVDTSGAGPGGNTGLWIATSIFLAIIGFMLALDLGVFHRKAHVVSMKEAATWSCIWLTIGLSFSGVVYAAYSNHWLGLGVDTPMYASGELAKATHGETTQLIIRGTVDGATAAQQYLVGYILEWSLAMDNIFVIALVFAYFGIPSQYQHRVLFWGIVGALIMRGVMIAVGAKLVLEFQWILIIFGVLLLLTAAKMAFMNGETDPGKNIIVRLAKRWFPVTETFHGQKFFVIENGVRMITPLFLALLVVEFTDLIFAVDSIPAIFGITPDPFIVFTSNILAIMGLRSLYFCLAALIAKFHYLKPALVLILAFVGVKLLLLSFPPYQGILLGWMGVGAASPIKIPTLASLIVVVSLLVGAVLTSIIFPKKPTAQEAAVENALHQP
jgi:tellurite resistance protein TerC